MEYDLDSGTDTGWYAARTDTWYYTYDASGFLILEEADEGTDGTIDSATTCIWRCCLGPNSL